MNRDAPEVIFEQGKVKVWRIPYEGIGYFYNRYSVQRGGEPVGNEYKTKAGAIRKAHRLTA